MPPLILTASKNRSIELQFSGPDALHVTVRLAAPLILCGCVTSLSTFDAAYECERPSETASLPPKLACSHYQNLGISQGLLGSEKSLRQSATTIDKQDADVEGHPPVSSSSSEKETVDADHGGDYSLVFIRTGLYNRILAAQSPNVPFNIIRLEDNLSLVVDHQRSGFPFDGSPFYLSLCRSGSQMASLLGKARNFCDTPTIA